jgi:hypothetical protein
VFVHRPIYPSSNNKGLEFIVQTWFFFLGSWNGVAFCLCLVCTIYLMSCWWWQGFSLSDYGECYKLWGKQNIQQMHWWLVVHKPSVLCD